jgi:hypothetical protein
MQKITNSTLQAPTPQIAEKWYASNISIAEKWYASTIRIASISIASITSMTRIH